MLDDFDPIEVFDLNPIEEADRAARITHEKNVMLKRGINLDNQEQLSNPDMWKLCEDDETNVNDMLERKHIQNSIYGDYDVGVA